MSRLWQSTKIRNYQTILKDRSIRCSIPRSGGTPDGVLKGNTFANFGNTRVKVLGRRGESLGKMTSSLYKSTKWSTWDWCSLTSLMSLLVARRTSLWPLITETLIFGFFMVVLSLTRFSWLGRAWILSVMTWLGNHWAKHIYLALPLEAIVVASSIMKHSAGKLPRTFQ